jgi:hypothetical protein
LRVTGAEQFAAAATKQIFPGKGVLFGHAFSSMGPSSKGLAAFTGPGNGGLIINTKHIDCRAVLKVTARQYVPARAPAGAATKLVGHFNTTGLAAKNY